jgi:hypothetical protein
MKTSPMLDQRWKNGLDEMLHKMADTAAVDFIAGTRHPMPTQTRWFSRGKLLPWRSTGHVVIAQRENCLPLRSGQFQEDESFYLAKA